jgi:hypothetical protein
MAISPEHEILLEMRELVEVEILASHRFAEFSPAHSNLSTVVV